MKKTNLKNLPSPLFSKEGNYTPLHPSQEGNSPLSKGDKGGCSSLWQREVRRDFFNYYFSLLILTVLGITLLLPASSSADDSHEETKILTIEQALEIAADKNRDIQKAKEYFNWVKGKYTEEKAAALPQFSINSSAIILKDRTETFSDERMKMYSGEIDVTQTLFAWGKIGAAIRAAEEGFGTAEEQLRLYRQAAYRDVSIAFYDILLTKELNAIARQNLEQKQRHLEEAKRKLTAGVATDYEVLAAEVAVKNARPDVIRTENEVRDSIERLRFLLKKRSGYCIAWGYRTDNAGIAINLNKTGKIRM
jgi:outer membrane protein TolC